MTKIPWITKALAGLTIFVVAAIIGVLAWSTWDTNIKRLELFEAYKNNIDACLHVDGCEVVPDGITVKVTCYPGRDNRGSYWAIMFRNGSELRVFDVCTPDNARPDPDFGGLVPEPVTPSASTDPRPEQDQQPNTDVPETANTSGGQVQPAAPAPAAPAAPAAPVTPAAPVEIPAPEQGLDDILCGIGVCVFQKATESILPVPVEILPGDGSLLNLGK